jgi:hypothetical protein
VFEWYEVFQPDDDTQPIQVTHREWDNANQQPVSPIYQLGPTASGTSSTNGTWFIARLDTKAKAGCPECKWRHVIGAGEPVVLTLDGLPASISGSATWRNTPITSGSISQDSDGNWIFVAGLTATNVTITATFPSNTACSGSTSLSITLNIVTPTGVTYKKLASVAMPAGELGVAMWGLYTIQPTTVCFFWLGFAEQACGASNVSGVYQPMNLVGLMNHNPLPPGTTGTNWIDIQADNTVDGPDYPSVGPYPWPAVALVGGGEFTWNIPIIYKLWGAPDATAQQFPNTVTQTMGIDKSKAFVIKNDVTEENDYDDEDY